LRRLERQHVLARRALAMARPSVHQLGPGRRAGLQGSPGNARSRERSRHRRDGRTGGATILGVLKPLLQLGKQIEKYTKLYTGYTGVYLDLKYIVEDIEKSKTVTRKVEDRCEM